MCGCVTVSVAAGSWYVYRQPNDVHRSSSLEVYYQCSVEQTHNNMLLELFCQIISEPCFDILRTQEQLGTTDYCCRCCCCQSACLQLPQLTHTHTHVAQLLPLPLTVSCSSKIQTGFIFLVPG